MGLKSTGLLSQASRIKSELFGSLGATGKGHGSDKAILLGLSGEQPDTTDIEQIEPRLAQIRDSGILHLLGERAVSYCEDSDLILHKRRNLPLHPNGMRFSAIGEGDHLLESRVYYSVGGGFVLEESEFKDDKLPQTSIDLPYPFSTGAELLSLCNSTGHSISKLMMENEKKLAIGRCSSEAAALYLASDAGDGRTGLPYRRSSTRGDESETPRGGSLPQTQG